MNKLLDTSFDGSSYETENNDADTSADKPSQRNVKLFGKEYNIKRSELTALILLSLYFFLNYLYFSLFVPFFPGVAKSKGMNQTQVGSIFAVFQLVQLFFAPLFGKYVPSSAKKALFSF